VLHPLWAPVHARRADRTDTRGPLHRAHVLHPSAPPRRGPRPGRRPRPVVPFDIPVEAFAVEIGGGAHPSVRSLGERRLVYVEHRRAARRAYRRRQLAFAVGLSGAFVAVAAVALVPGGHADAAPARHADAASDSAVSATRTTDGHGPNPVSAADSRPVEPPFLRAHRSPGGPSAVRPVSAVYPLHRRPPKVHHVPAFRPESPTPAANPLANDEFLECTRGYESIYAGGYAAVGDGGRYRGAYQFDQPTWDGTAEHLHRFDLVGVPADRAAPAVQDLFAYTLYKWQGAGHWNGRCAGLP
jgi:Transglycosylase-like domain